VVREDVCDVALVRLEVTVQEGVEIEQQQPVAAAHASR
jgi:hypothetical protein